jgi:hypothetical protein
MTEAHTLFDVQDGDHPIVFRTLKAANTRLCLRHLTDMNILNQHFPLGSGLMMYLYRLKTHKPKGA